MEYYILDERKIESVQVVQIVRQVRDLARLTLAFVTLSMYVYL